MYGFLFLFNMFLCDFTAFMIIFEFILRHFNEYLSHILMLEYCVPCGELFSLSLFVAFLLLIFSIGGKICWFSLLETIIFELSSVA